MHRFDEIARQPKTPLTGVRQLWLWVSAPNLMPLHFIDICWHMLISWHKSLGVLVYFRGYLVETQVSGHSRLLREMA